MIGLKADEMAKSRHGGSDRLLTLKGLTWWAKIEIPKDCRSALGDKTALVLSMDTGDIREARRRRDAFEEEHKGTFAAIRAGTYDPENKRANAAQQGALWRETLAELREDPETPEALLDAAAAAEEQERESLRGAERAAFERALKGAVPFNHHANAYLKAIKLAEKTTKERAGLLAMVSDWFTAKGLTLDKLGRREVGRYCSEVLEDLHPVTAQKRLGAARGYWDWLMTKGHVLRADGNPWAGQLQASKKRRVERDEAEDAEERPFTDEEVTVLLTSAWPARQKEANRAILLDGLALGLLSGLREAEVANLRVGDIEHPEGAPLGVLRVREGKTASAIRRVPVHPALAPMIARRCDRKKPDAMLFHDLWDGREAGKGSAADAFGKAFRRYRLALNVDDKREGKRRSLVNFHSARRWFATKSAQAGIPLDTIAAVIGHSDKSSKHSMTLRYIEGLIDAQLRECVESVVLPELVCRKLAPLPATSG
ncbi:tyrosine-type recombinase/integrase [Rhodobacter lacus]|uniref:Tyrosine-type recombinase/integrase n=1 Tax=Rhodobacter lacus TaxID=1641972 RepID=A0ABW5ABN9_9RHOB